MKIKIDNIDYSTIDEGIRDLVRTLNRIPFVATSSSCEWHLTDYMHQIATPDIGHIFLDSGHIFFNLDKRYKQGGPFLGEVRRLAASYPFAELTEHHCSESHCDIEGHQMFTVYPKVLTPHEIAREDNTLEIRLKRFYQLELKAAQKRVVEYNRVWCDFLEIAKKYAGR